MADQNITALPVSTEPVSSDQLLLVGAAEEKLIDYDKLADAILNKLTSKNFSLDQGTMTLMSALNQLNSNKLDRKYIEINITTDSDGRAIVPYTADKILNCTVRDVSLLAFVRYTAIANQSLVYLVDVSTLKYVANKTASLSIRYIK